MFHYCGKVYTELLPVNDTPTDPQVRCMSQGKINNLIIVLLQSVFFAVRSCFSIRCLEPREREIHLTEHIQARSTDAQARRTDKTHIDTLTDESDL